MSAMSQTNVIEGHIDAKGSKARRRGKPFQRLHHRKVARGGR